MGNFRFKFLGQASFLYDFNGITVLIDPWFSLSGAFLNSWYQWPPNHYLVSSEVLKPDYLWLSHEHSDHFDPKFLDQVDKNVKILAPHFEDDGFIKKIKSIGFSQIIPLHHLEEYAHSSELKFRMLIEQPVRNEHSSLMINFQGTSIFNNSDSSFSIPFFESIKSDFKPAIYTGQYSITSPFPDVMEWDDSLKDRFKLEHMNWSRSRFTNAVNTLEIPFAIPCAGPVLHISDNKIEKTLQRLFAPKTEYDEAYNYDLIREACPNSKILFMSPGDELEYPFTDKALNRRLHTADEKKEFFEEVLRTRTIDKCFFHDDALTIIKLHAEKFTDAVSKCPEILKKLNELQYCIYLIDLDYTISNHFKLSGLEVSGAVGKQHVDNPSEKFYRISVHSSLWSGFLNSRFPFDELHYSQRYSIFQSKVGYNAHLFDWLRAFQSEKMLTKLQNEFLQINVPSMEVYFEGKTYKVKKHCPHLKFSLENSKPDKNGVITCSGHGWRFDVKTGKCLYGDLSKNIQIDSVME